MVIVIPEFAANSLTAACTATQASSLNPLSALFPSSTCCFIDSKSSVSAAGHHLSRDLRAAEAASGAAGKGEGAFEGPGGKGEGAFQGPGVDGRDGIKQSKGCAMMENGK